jgi:hypothetical protein
MENIVQGQWFRGPSADLGDEIAQSLRFSGGQQLTRTITTDSAGTTSTFSFWFKLGNSANSNNEAIFSYGGSSYFFISPSGTQTLRIYGGGAADCDWTGKTRDYSSWYHVVLQGHGNGNSTDNKCWLNGREISTEFNSRDFPGITQGNATFKIGNNSNDIRPFNGYLADFICVNGSAVAPTEFGRYNDDGVWVPKNYSGSYGSKGFRLKFDSSAGLGDDSSGNGNDFTPSGFDTTAISSANRLNDIDIKDTPTSNYATFNPLWHQTTPSLKGANMELNTAQTITGQATFRFPVGTTGKYWVETGTASYGATTNSPAILLTSELDAAGLSNTSWSTQANYSGIGGHSGDFYTNFNSTTANAYTETTGQVALGINFDDQEVLMYNGGTLINTDTTVDFTKELALNIQQPDTSFNTYDPYINAGQQTHIQSPPAGYKALQTNNLPEPTIKNGRDHFDSVIWTGTGAENYDVTGFEFQPDLVWIKRRNGANNHNLYDSLRGVTKHLTPNENYGESTTANSLTAFNSDGFEVGTGASDNTSGQTMVAWCWKAGGAPTATNSNSAGTAQTAGSVKVDGANGSFAHGTIKANKMSVNTTAGFSIVQYTGTQTAGSIPHGLGAVPEMAIVKRSDAAGDWHVYHKDLAGDATRQIYLNQGSTQSGTSSDYWNNTLPTSTTLTLGGATQNNTNNGEYNAYIWTSIPGYSKFGGYVGNSNSDGPFIYLGFKPAFLMVRVYTGSGNWMMWDTSRSPTNSVQNRVLANTANTEGSYSSQEIDILSNGFKLRGTDSDVNAGYNYIYMAFAENPFGGENQPPATAR